MVGSDAIIAIVTITLQVVLASDNPKVQEDTGLGVVVEVVLDELPEAKPLGDRLPRPTTSSKALYYSSNK